MPHIYYECCDVASWEPDEDGWLARKKFCWNCEVCDPLNWEFSYNLVDGHPFRNFLVIGRMIRPTGEPPPWAI